MGAESWGGGGEPEPLEGRRGSWHSGTYREFADKCQRGPVGTAESSRSWERGRRGQKGGAHPYGNQSPGVGGDLGDQVSSEGPPIRMNMDPRGAASALEMF